MAPVIETMGRWRYEQLRPLDLCGLHADLGRLLGPALRSVVIKALLILGASEQAGETLDAKVKRVLGALDGRDGPALQRFVAGLMSRLDRPWAEAVQELDMVTLALAEVTRVLDGDAVMRLIEQVLVTREGRRGGLSYQVVPGAKEYVPIAGVDDLNEQTSLDPLELWRLFAWALMINLRPITAAAHTWVARRLTVPPGTGGPTPTTGGPSTSSPPP